MIWVHTCEFHIKFPLDYSIYCDCHFEYRLVDNIFMEKPLFTYIKEDIKENDSN